MAPRLKKPPNSRLKKHVFSDKSSDFYPTDTSPHSHTSAFVWLLVGLIVDVDFKS